MQANQAAVKRSAQQKWQGWKHSAPVRVLLFFVFALLFHLSLGDRLVPQTFDIKPDTQSEKTILAPRQIENAAATEKAKDEAAGSVAPVYQIVTINNSQLIENMYDKIELSINDAEMKFEQKLSYYHSVFPSLMNDAQDRLIIALKKTGEPYNDTLLTDIRKQFDDQVYKIQEESYYKLPRLTREDLAAMEPITKDIVSKLMNDQIADAASARSKVTELVNSSNLSKSTNRELVQEIAKFAITPNKFIDLKSTEAAKLHARENTKTVFVNKNDVLVEKGQIITADIYQQLEKADMLRSKKNFKPPLGLLLLISFFVAALYMYVRRSKLPISVSNVQLVMLLMIFILNVLAMRIIALGQNLDYPHIAFLAPVGLGSMLIVILLDSQLALVSSILFALMSSVIFNAEPDKLFDFRYGLAALVVSVVSILSLNKASQRSTILKAGVLVSFFGALAIASLLLMENRFTVGGLTAVVIFAIAGGLLTSVLVLGLMPFFETVFGILSPLKLVELSNPNQPLLRKLLTETPGTYHHSVMVGNLAEAAAEAIGADGLLCRVGAFYHDIGKTKRPGYFIENQMNMENPHNTIEPELSKAIIIAHPRDGVEMLKEHKLPKPIQDIAEQHHGTTLLKFFHHKACQQAASTGKTIEEEDYRYPGPKAQSKEAAIVGIADCIEAAVRSLSHPTIEQIDSMVHKIIKDRLDDGQFNECDLTLKELDTAGQALKEALLGIFHSRIEYPSDLEQNKNGGKELKTNVVDLGLEQRSRRL